MPTLQSEIQFNTCGGVYHPLRFWIKLYKPSLDFCNSTQPDLFKPQGPWSWSLFLHEYFHYLQNISSVPAIVVFNNWVATQILNIREFNLPSYKKAEVDNFFDDCILLHSTKLQLGSSTEANQFVDSNNVITLDGKQIARDFPIKTLSMQAADATIKTIPLNIAAFCEGFSKSLQWYIEGNIPSSSVADYPIQNEDAFYSLVRRWIDTKKISASNKNCLTMLICDTCLASNDPGHIFQKIDTYFTSNTIQLNTPQDYLELRRKFQQEFETINFDLLRAFKITKELELSCSKETGEAVLGIRKILIKMQTALLARLVEPEHFLWWSPNPADIYDHFRKLYDVPTIYTNDKTFPSDWLGKSVFPFTASAHLAEEIVYKQTSLSCPFSGKCPYTAGDYCQSPKNYIGRGHTGCAAIDFLSPQ